jgi:hypothetical protein
LQARLPVIQAGPSSLVMLVIDGPPRVVRIQGTYHGCTDDNRHAKDDTHNDEVRVTLLLAKEGVELPCMCGIAAELPVPSDRHTDSQSRHRHTWFHAPQHVTFGPANQAIRSVVKRLRFELAVPTRHELVNLGAHADVSHIQTYDTIQQRTGLQLQHSELLYTSTSAKKSCHEDPTMCVRRRHNGRLITTPGRPSAGISKETQSHKTVASKSFLSCHQPAINHLVSRGRFHNDQSCYPTLATCIF